MLTETPAPQATESPAPKAAGRRPRKWVVISLTAVIGVFLILGGVAAVMATGDRSERTEPRLTHIVARGDVVVSVTEQGTLESSENTEIKCRVRGQNTVTFVIESGSYVQPGDVLVELDTLALEEAIAERRKYAHWSRSGAERSKADVARSEIAVKEYEQGRYVSALATLEKDLSVAKANLVTAQNMLRHTKSLFERGYRSELDVQERQFAVKQAELDVSVRETNIEVLKNFTKREQMETLRGNLKATIARHKANAERAGADASRRDRALEELEHCVIKAERAGLVIYPSAAAWKNAPDIEEGATVHKDQILLLMPDLSRMQVKVGIHESIVDRVHPGLSAIVRLSDGQMDASVTSVASITTPGGWWNGNRVEYDTIIRLPNEEGLKPGMSAEVEIIIARHENVLRIPVAAVLEIADGHLCWVRTADGVERRSLQLGDSNDVYVVVESGLKEGDEVILNPIAYVDEAQSEALRPQDVEAESDGQDTAASLDEVVK